MHSIIKNENSGSFSIRQQIFFRFTLCVLIDLTVLNLFNEYWDHVFIEKFSISLLAALLLQILLRITIAIEHSVASRFKDNPTLKAKVYRVLSTWAILFISKLVILEAISYIFDESVLFKGPLHGLITFIIVVTAIIVAEQIFIKIYKSLSNQTQPV